MMSVLDLRSEGRSAPPIDLRGVTASELEAATSNWRARMASEYVSARVFGELLGQMIRAGLPAAETRRVADMARQEIEHGLLCARVLASLGAEAVADLPELEDVPRHLDASSPLEAVLRNVISIGCCSETVAVALVGTERELAGPPLVREVLDRILADEVKHSRFGWRIVSRLAPLLSDAEREGLNAYLVDCFRHQVRFHRPFLSMSNASPEGVALGAPNGASNWLVFVGAATEIIVPGLTKLGFAADVAWQKALC